MIDCLAWAAMASWLLPSRLYVLRPAWTSIARRPVPTPSVLVFNVWLLWLWGWFAAHAQLPLFTRAEEMTFAVKGLFNYRAVTSKILRSKMEYEVSMAAELWLVRLRDVSLWYMR